MAQDTKAHQTHWDSKYSRGNTHSDYVPDKDLVKLIHHFPTNGLALDVACGTGRNSFFIAEHGLDVVCMDFSSKGLNYLKQHRADEPVSKKLFPVQADLTQLSLPKNNYDAVFVIRYLDRGAFPSYTDTLKPGGLLFIKAFNLNHLKRKPNFNPDFLLNPGELASTFKQFEIIYTNDDESTADFESVILIRT